MYFGRRFSTLVVAVVAWLGTAMFTAQSHALTITISGVNGNLSAKAVFTTNGSGELFLILTNTATVASDGPATTLNAVFFDGSLTGWSPVSAKLTDSTDKAYVDGSNGKWQLFSTTDSSFNTSGNVGGEWATGTNVSNQQAPAHAWSYGVSSSGLSNTFGPLNLIDTTQNLAGPTSPDGNQFGLVADSTVTLGAKVPSNFTGTNNTPVVANSVTFDLGHVPTFNIHSITGAEFIYGTALPPENQITVVTITPSTDSVPLPSPAFAGVALLAFCGVLRLRASRANT